MIRSHIKGIIFHLDTHAYYFLKNHNLVHYDNITIRDHGISI